MTDSNAEDAMASLCLSIRTAQQTIKLTNDPTKTGEIEAAIVLLNEHRSQLAQDLALSAKLKRMNSIIASTPAFNQTDNIPIELSRKIPNGTDTFVVSVAISQTDRNQTVHPVETRRV